MNNLQKQFGDQQFSNEYQLVNGVAMHAENPDNFQIPPDVIKSTLSRTSLSNFGSTHQDSLSMKKQRNAHALRVMVNSPSRSCDTIILHHWFRLQVKTHHPEAGVKISGLRS